MVKQEQIPTRYDSVFGPIDRVLQYTWLSPNLQFQITLVAVFHSRFPTFWYFHLTGKLFYLLRGSNIGLVFSKQIGLFPKVPFVKMRVERKKTPLLSSEVAHLPHIEVLYGHVFLKTSSSQKSRLDCSAKKSHETGNSVVTSIQNFMFESSASLVTWILLVETTRLINFWSVAFNYCLTDKQAFQLETFGTSNATTVAIFCVHMLSMAWDVSCEEDAWKCGEFLAWDSHMSVHLYWTHATDSQHPT